MHDRLAYPYEKFSNAIMAMASSPASLQERLLTAYSSFHPINESDFEEEEDRRMYREIMDALTVVKDPDVGYVPATVRQMDDEEARRVANLIVDLFFSINSRRRS